MSEFVALLDSSPILLFAVVAALGSLLGSIPVKGTTLGVAAVLFVGLGVSAVRPAARLPEDFQQLGLVLFVYTIGLASGPSFVTSLRTQGVRAAALVAVAVALGAAVVLALGQAGFAPGHGAGLFAGALTNTPALAEATQRLREVAGPEAGVGATIGYAVAYPLGVIGAIAAVALALRTHPARPAAEAEEPPPGPVVTVTAAVGGPYAGHRVGEVRRALGEGVSFGRVRVGTHDHVAADDVVLEPGALISVVGAPAEVARAVDALGGPSRVDLTLDRSDLDVRRIVVSRPAHVGVPLGELDLGALGAHVTRVRRGDVDFVPTDRTRLEPGDRVRVLAPRAQMGAVTAFFGDSMRVFSEVDMLTFGLGVGLGVVVGGLEVPLPGGMTLKLGLAGGPLIVGLALGAMRRVGPLSFALPSSANQMLRQLGLVLFFAAVGTRSGAAFASVAFTWDGARLLAMGAALTAIVYGTALVAAHRLLGLSGPALAGLLAGLATQPAALAFANERAPGERASVAYATVYPVATVTKILAAPILVRLLGG